MDKAGLSQPWVAILAVWALGMLCCWVRNPASILWMEKAWVSLAEFSRMLGRTIHLGVTGHLWCPTPRHSTREGHHKLTRVGTNGTTPQITVGKSMMELRAELSIFCITASGNHWWPLLPSQHTQSRNKSKKTLPGTPSEISKKGYLVPALQLLDPTWTKAHVHPQGSYWGDYCPQLLALPISRIRFCLFHRLFYASQAYSHSCFRGNHLYVQ